MMNVNPNLTFGSRISFKNEYPKKIVNGFSSLNWAEKQKLTRTLNKFAHNVENDGRNNFQLQVNAVGDDCSNGPPNPQIGLTLAVDHAIEDNNYVNVNEQNLLKSLVDSFNKMKHRYDNKGFHNNIDKSE